jgi:hypothetical protein
MPPKPMSADQDSPFALLNAPTATPNPDAGVWFAVPSAGACQLIAASEATVTAKKRNCVESSTHEFGREI